MGIENKTNKFTEKTSRRWTLLHGTQSQFIIIIMRLTRYYFIEFRKLLDFDILCNQYLCHTRNVPRNFYTKKKFQRIFLAHRFFLSEAHSAHMEKSRQIISKLAFLKRACQLNKRSIWFSNHRNENQNALHSQMGCNKLSKKSARVSVALLHVNKSISQRSEPV